MSGRNMELRVIPAGGGSGGGAPSGAAGGVLSGTYPNPGFASIADQRIMGNVSGGAAGQIALTAAQVKTMLAVDLSTADVTGILAAARFPALTGDVTTAGGALAATIANSAVTVAKMANMAANTVLANTTGGALAPVATSLATFKTWLALVAGDVGLGNVNNTSNATERAATATLTNKRVTKRTFALTDAATILVNTDNWDNGTVVLGGNRTLGDTSGTPTDGDVWTVEVKQDGTGGRTLSVTDTNTIVSNDLGGANGTVATIPLDTGAGRYSLLMFRYSATLAKAVLVSVVRY